MRNKIFRKAIIILLFPIFFSCTKNNNSVSKDSKNLTALFVYKYQKIDINKFVWLNNLASKHNLNINWICKSEEEWNREKNYYFLNKNIPDILINATTANDYYLYPNLFTDFNKIIGDITPNIIAMFSKSVELRMAASNYDGAIYALPSFIPFEPQFSSVIFINQQWLKKLKLTIPESLEDMTKVLKTFKELDANKNGVSEDEIPLDFTGWSGNTYSALMLLGSFGIQLTNGGKNGYFLENDLVKNYYIDERYKKLLTYLTQWYKEGYFKETSLYEVPYSSYTRRSHSAENGLATVGIAFGKEETEQFGQDLASQYISILPPIEKDAENSYKRTWSYDYTSQNIKTDRIALSSKCKQNKNAIAFIDSLYNIDSSIQSYFGGIADGFVEKVDINVKASDIEKQEKNNYLYKIVSDKNKTLPIDIRRDNAFCELGVSYIPKDTIIALPYDFTYAQLERKNYQKLTPKKGSYYPEIYIKYSSSQTKTLNDIEKNINTIAENARLRWIKGEGNIEEEWEQYVNDIVQAGLYDAIKIRQTAFNKCIKEQRLN
ncbi:MAG: extracellular solute-binding protein [Treponema sp.]|nr:extracellular solute-binding protein [Treponema sp.]